jgi:alkanesulfonate monooxygenase SsuD/methylene tetrahydromethanopterin reductase-like flavin-dependent oxidoreductase (luciferase family)
MRYAVSSPNIGAAGELVDLAVASEVAGWDAFFLWDHLHLIRDLRLEVHDPWVLLGAMAQATSTIKLGTMVTPVARRRPQKLAKEIVTLDHLSGGRVIFGVGLGWPADDEFGAFGEPTDDRVRADLLDAGLATIAQVCRGESTLFPAAVQQPGPPVWVAAMAPARRPLRRAARYAGVVPLANEGAPTHPREIAQYLATEPELVAAMARPDFDVVMSWAPDTKPSEYEELGATWLVESSWVSEDDRADLRTRVEAGPPR